MATTRRTGNWRRMRLWCTAHAVDDLYQGLVPASVPYFVLDRHYSYVAASGLPFSVMIKLGQDYLPSRPGTASGVTLGLGAIAEDWGIASVFTVMCFVPVLALVLGALLPDPAAPSSAPGVTP